MPFRIWTLLRKRTVFAAVKIIFFVQLLSFVGFNGNRKTDHQSFIQQSINWNCQSENAVLTWGVLFKFWKLFLFINAYYSACPTPIHRDLEQGIFRSHSLRFAGRVTRSQKHGRGKAGFREGGRHGEDKVSVNSARWRMTHRHTCSYAKVRWTKRSEISGGNW